MGTPESGTSQGTTPQWLLSRAPISPDRPPGAEEGFHLLVDNATEYAVFALSPEGLVSTWNRGAARIKGYEPHEIIGRRYDVFYTAEDRNDGLPDRLLRQAVEMGRAMAEGWRVRRDGSRFWATVVITPLRDEEGLLRGFAKLTRDDSDRRAAEKVAAEVTRLAESEQLAAELGDTVVRRLGSVGLTLGAVVERLDDPDLRSRLIHAVDETDLAIRELRQAVLRRPDDR